MSLGFNHLLKLSSIRNYASMARNIIGLTQMRSTNDKNFNREQISELFKRSSGKASFLFFPECCDYVGSNVEETIRLSEPLTGDTVSFYKNLCRENKVWASFGGIHEKIEGSSKIHNTHIIINSEGELVDCYRKLHLFDVDTPDFKFRESKIVEGGKEISFPVETPIGKIGLQIVSIKPKNFYQIRRFKIKSGDLKLNPKFNPWI